MSHGIPMRWGWARAEVLGLAWALGMALFSSLSFVLYLAAVPGGVGAVAALALSFGGGALGLRWLRTIRRREEVADASADSAERPRLHIPQLRRAGVTPRERRRSQGAAALHNHRSTHLAPVAVVVGLGMAALQVALAGWVAVRSPFGAWDAWSFWVLKARMFAGGGPGPGYFRDPLTLYTHPDYPLNVPLAAALFLRMPGRLGVELAALIGPACFAALLLLFYAGLTRLHGGTMAALATAALALVPALPMQAAGGDADVPLAMYLGAAALYLLLWWRLRRSADAVLMGLLAGGAVWTKKEGLPVAALLLLAYGAGEILRHHPSRRDHRTERRLDGRGYGVRSTQPARSRWLAGWQRQRGPAVPVFAGGTPAVPADIALSQTPERRWPAWCASTTQAGGVALAALALPLPWLLFCRAVRPLGRDFLPLTPAVFLAHADRLPHILALFLLQALAFGNWALLWALLAALLLPAARRLSPSGRGLALVLLAQLGVYAVSFVFSDWQPYVAHVQTSLDRLLLQAVPLALLLLVELIHAPAPARGAVGEMHGTSAGGDAAA